MPARTPVTRRSVSAFDELRMRRMNAVYPQWPPVAVGHEAWGWRVSDQWASVWQLQVVCLFFSLPHGVNRAKNLTSTALGTLLLCCLRIPMADEDPVSAPPPCDVCGKTFGVHLNRLHAHTLALHRSSKKHINAISQCPWQTSPQVARVKLLTKKQAVQHMFSAKK